MSRLAKTPVDLPKNVKVSFDKINVNVEGPKGKLSMAIPSDVVLEQKDNKLFVNRLSRHQAGPFQSWDHQAVD